MKKYTKTIHKKSSSGSVSEYSLFFLPSCTNVRMRVSSTVGERLSDLYLRNRMRGPQKRWLFKRYHPRRSAHEPPRRLDSPTCYRLQRRRPVGESGPKTLPIKLKGPLLLDSCMPTETVSSSRSAQRILLYLFHSGIEGYRRSRMRSYTTRTNRRSAL